MNNSGVQRRSGRYPWGIKSPISEMTKNLTNEYANDEDICRTRCSLYMKAVQDHKITMKDLNAARAYYGTLWNYTGD